MKLTSEPDSSRPRRAERRLRAVAVLPSLATLGNLVCGFGAIYLCFISALSTPEDLVRPTFNNVHAERWFPTYLAIAAYLVFVAMVFDVLDGRLARLARKTSDFGAQLDSLADVVSFGVAPALLVLCIARPPGGVAAVEGLERAWWRAAWAMAAVYACCAAVRLARFNVESVCSESARKQFKGLPSPGAAAAICSLIILHEEFLRAAARDWLIVLVQQLCPVYAIVVGLLMVSRLRYPHLVNMLLRGRRPLGHVLVMTAVILAFTIFPQGTIAALALGYVLLGPAAAVWRRIHGLPQAAGQSEPHAPEAPHGRASAG